MKRDQMKRILYASVIAEFWTATPVVLLANAPGTMCSWAQSGGLIVFAPIISPMIYARKSRMSAAITALIWVFLRVCCGKKAI